MRTEFLCSSVLRVTSGPRVKLAGHKSASTTHPTPTGSAVSLTLCYFVVLFYEAICFMS